jgi:hypothetical protein
LRVPPESRHGPVRRGAVSTLVGAGVVYVVMVVSFAP